MLSDQALNWEKMAGLIPVIVQHAHTGTVLMLGYMNHAAFEITRSSRQATFYSRSRQTLWVKGESSGHYLNVVSMTPDCDGDALLLLALPNGPTCHLMTNSCFPGAAFSLGWISDIATLLESRKENVINSSYVQHLFKSGINRIAQKIGEEAIETALAAVSENDATLLEEMADLFFHMQVLLSAKGCTFIEVLAVLKKRMSEGKRFASSSD